MLAAKAALATRVDALGDDVNAELGVEHRAKVEARIKALEGGHSYKLSGTAKQTAKHDKYEHKSEIVTYKDAADSNLKKRKKDNGENEAEVKPKKIKVEEEVRFNKRPV